MISVGQKRRRGRSRVRRGVSGWRGARKSSEREPNGGDTPDLGGGTGRCHGESDAANTDAHESTDLEQFEPDGPAGGVGQGGAVQPNASRSEEHTSALQSQFHLV